MSGRVCHAGSPIPAVTLSPPRRTGAALADVLLRLAERVVSWQERARSRRALLALDDRLLRDIGVDRATAQSEGEQPFWRS